MFRRNLRILCVYKEFPHPKASHAGGVAVYDVLAALAARGHSLDLVARIRDDEAHLLPDIQKQFRRVVTVPHHQSSSWVGTRPIRIYKSYAALRKAVQVILASIQYDILYVEFTTSGASLIGLPIDLPKTIRIHDIWEKVFAQKAERAGDVSILQRLWNLSASIVVRGAERALYGKYDHILAISDGDRQTLAKDFHFPLHKIGMLPTRSKIFVRSDAHACHEPKVLFVGAMNRPINAEAVVFFAHHVLPRVKACVSNVRFQIVGSNPLPEVRALANIEGVEVTGWVESVEPYYADACVFVSPLLVGGGIIVKVMDALANGVPVVMTSASNLGIGAIHGEHAFIADNPQEFAQYVCQLLADGDLRRRLAANARAWVSTVYDFEASVNRLEQVFYELLARSSSR